MFKNRRFWTFGLALALGAGVLVAAGLAAGGQPDQGAALQAQAIEALGVKDEECVATSDPSGPRPDADALAAEAKALGKHGKGAAAFFGASAELVADLKGKSVASEPTEIWVLYADTTGPVVTQFHKIDLKDGLPPAWIRGAQVRQVQCAAS